MIKCMLSLQPTRRAPCLSPYNTWDSLQPQHDPELNQWSREQWYVKHVNINLVLYAKYK